MDSLISHEGSGKLPCTWVNNLTTDQEQCNFIMHNDCQEDEALDYVYFVYCIIGSEFRYMSILVVVGVILVLFAALSSLADEFLCPCLLTVAKTLRMSDSLAGVTLLAFGNGCPDIFSSFAGAKDHRAKLVVSELLGAGIFCTSIVAGLIFIRRDFKLTCRPVLRDTIFYLFAVYMTWFYCWREVLTFYQALSFILIYVVYLFVAVGGQIIHSNMRSGDIVSMTIKTLDDKSQDDRNHVMAMGSQLSIPTTLSDLSVKLDPPKSDCWFTERQNSLRRRKLEAIQQRQSENKTLLSNSANNLNVADYNGLTQLDTVTNTGASHRKKPKVGPNLSLEMQLECSLSKLANQNQKPISGCDNLGFSGQGEDITTNQMSSSAASPSSKSKNDSRTPLSKITSFTSSSTPSSSSVPMPFRRNSSLGSLNASLVSQRGPSLLTLDDWDDLLLNINPFDSSSSPWSETTCLRKIIIVMRSPLIFLAIMTVPVVDQDKPKRNWCRILNSLHCVMVPLMIILSNKIVARDGVIFGNLTYPVAVTIPGLILAIVMLKFTSSREPPKYHSALAFVGFMMSILWIYTLVTEILALLNTIGILFNMSDTAIGLTFLAWGNSLGDIVANLTLANAGYPRMALGASIGAPLLNLLLGFGLAFAYNIEPGESEPFEYSATITLLCSCLAIILLTLMFSTLMPREQSKRPLGFLLIAIYLVYFILAFLIEFNFVKFD